MIQPNDGRCAVKKIENMTTPGGLVIVGNKNVTVITGKIVAVGPALDDQKTDFTVGDVVAFQQYHETGTEIDGVIVIRYSDLLGKVS